MGTPASLIASGDRQRGGGVERTSNSDSVLEWMARLRVTQGPNAGEPLVLLDWEQDFIRRALAPGVRQAALSVARGNGKTTIVAAIAAAAIAGPLRQPRSEVPLVAASYQQARIAFEHCFAFIKDEFFWPRADWRIRNSIHAAGIDHVPSGAKIRLLSSDPKRAHGIAPYLVIADEPSQWDTGQGSRMYAALLTSLGKIPGSRLIALGTRPSRTDHWFQRLLDSDERSIVTACYAGEPECDVHDPRQWRMANPSMDAMPELREAIRAESEAARKNPALLAAFRALRLNLGTPDSESREMLLDVEQWRATCAVPAPRRGAYVLGLDVGGALALSAAVAVWPASGRLEAMAQCGRVPDLDRRGAIDGVGSLYEQAHAAGELRLNDGRVAGIAELLERARDEWGVPEVLVCDRWRIAELRDVLDRLALRPAVMPRGQGYKDGNDDVRRFRVAVAEKRVHPARQFMLLEAGIADAVVTSDPAGNVKLAKSTEGGRRACARDDVAAAAILAVAHADRIMARPARTSPAAVVA